MKQNHSRSLTTLSPPPRFPLSPPPSISCPIPVPICSSSVWVNDQMDVLKNSKYDVRDKKRMGGYAEIYRCRDRETGQIVAIKKIVNIRDNGVPSTTIREVSLLKELNHVNIIRLLDVLNFEDGVYIVLEYFDLDLHEFMHSQSIPKDQIKNILQQMLSAVAYCHSNKIVHGDLRPENFLIDHTNNIVKLANFESAGSFEVLPIKYGRQVATNSYGAPELLYVSCQYLTAIDMFTVGCIFREMGTMRRLFISKEKWNRLGKNFSLTGTQTKEKLGLNCLCATSLCSFLPPVPEIRQDDHAEKFLGLDPAGCDLLSKMLCRGPFQRISAEDALEHYYFNSLKKDVKPALEIRPTEIRGSMNTHHQGNESKNEFGQAEMPMKPPVDPHHKDENDFDSRRREDIVYPPDNRSENKVTCSPTEQPLEPSRGTNYADENNAQSQTVEQTVKPFDNPQNGDGTDVESWPVELSSEPPADPHHKDECDFDSRRGEQHDESPDDPNNESENNLSFNPREEPMGPSLVTNHTDENDVESGTVENLVNPVDDPQNQDGTKVESRPTEQNDEKSAEIPQMLAKKAAENLMSDPHHKDESDLNFRREHLSAPPDDPDSVSKDILRRDPTEQPFEPSCASHHADKDDVQSGTEEHLVKPFDDLKVQDERDLNSRREHLVALPDNRDSMSEDNLRSGPTEQPLEPSHGSHHGDKDDVQSGTEEHLVNLVKPLYDLKVQDERHLNSRREHLVALPDNPDSMSEENLRSGPTEQPLEPFRGSHHGDKDDVQSGAEEHSVKPLDDHKIQDGTDVESRLAELSVVLPVDPLDYPDKRSGNNMRSESPEELKLAVSC